MLETREAVGLSSEGVRLLSAILQQASLVCWEGFGLNADMRLSYRAALGTTAIAAKELADAGLASVPYIHDSECVEFVFYGQYVTIMPPEIIQK